MSNTDGEDIQRIEGFNPGDKAYILTEEQYIKFEKQNDVIADLKFKLKNDAIFQEYSDLEKELASLREQLATEQDMCSTAEFANRMIIKDLNEKLKQKEDENRELLTVLKSIESKYTPFNKRVHDDDIYAITEVLRKNLSA